MLQPAVVPLFEREIEKILNAGSWSVKEKALALAGLIERAFFEATKAEQIAFNTFFSRICYAGQRFAFPADSLRKIHQFRLIIKQLRNGNSANEQLLQTGTLALREALKHLCKPAAYPSPIDVPSLVEEAAPNTYEEKNLHSLRVLALRDVPGQDYMVVSDEQNPGVELRVRYNVADRNENFNPSIQIIRKVFGFPVALNLLELDIDREGFLLPRAIVVEPDYLMDVSAIAECFKDTGTEPFSFLVRKFLPHDTTEPILLGNIANFFLDRLLNEPTVEWQKLFLETFQLYPFVYAPMSDSQVKSISGKAQKHFLNIKRMAVEGFMQQGIDPANCVLEPAFFSNIYGIQGRLDLFYKRNEQSAIVELKSGAPFKPNIYGISRSHFTQTLLYDLLVRSVFGKQIDPLKYILYSGVDVQQLRFAPTIASEQWEALQVRNQLVAIERMLTKITAGDSTVPSFGRINPEKAQGFTVRDFTRFEKAYQALSLLEKKYFNAFTGFIAREHWLAKVGEENSDSINGYASLWRSSFEDKVLNFNILSHLEIVENQADTAAHTILFRKTAQTNELANFRVGDIAVLYPSFSTGDTVLRHQVIKCSIIRLEKDRVEVQLRFQQHNLKPFQTNGLWSLEPDMLDSGFVGMYRGLLEWAETGKNTREKLLGLRVPAAPPAQQSNGLLEKIISSPDFFLLWGPPGTGKTSVLLRDIAQWVLKNTNENLLILAYTNRAVDEICEALDSIGDNVRELYLRIGGKHASSERFSGQLLSSKIAGAGNRSALREVLEKHRIFVSTVASFAQNEGLLKLKKFQRLVVDEASQILEPQLLGLLSRFEHFILIGDHRQLPAVSAQRPESSVVKDPDLNEIGLVDLRDSYFERLYLLCKRKQWHWAYDQLEQQGRMHEDIMAFPAKWFYDNGLQVFDPVHQKSALCYKLPENNSKLGAILAQKRVLFLPVSSPIPNPHQQKTSMEEATLCAEIVQCYKQLWKLNGKKWLPEKTLGIITPWRAQIAQIRSALHNAGIDPEQVTVDTVERYQGGARDIIVISTCVHSEWQLQSLLNISSEGVDRKLNVALTRAREHLIMLGNAAVLQQDERYAVFIKNHQEALENSSEIV